jgi:PBP1b-binding outer membrane lipoprotein LpoB
MIKKIVVKCILIVLVLSTVACGGLNFNLLAPEAIDFHPQRIAVFPIEVWNHKEADSRTIVEEIVAGVLIKRKLFFSVTDAESLQKQILASEELKKTKNEYLSKRRLLDFYDSDLSKKIGVLVQIDAFLLLSVDEWKYTEQGDKKIAQVGLTMEMYDVATGKLMWKAHHAITKDYMLIKPELPDIAREVASKMANYMPH